MIASDFTIERTYNHMTITEFQNYIKNFSNDTNIQDVEKLIKNLLKKEIEQGYRDSVTGEKITPNAEPSSHIISFEVYYGNKGKITAQKTLNALNGLEDTIAAIIDSEIVDNKCSRYVFKMNTMQTNSKLVNIIYNNGASSVYLNN